MENLNIALVGGAGYVGENLCDQLLKEGCKVMVIDSFIPPKFSSNFRNFGNLQLSVIDIMWTDVMKNALQNFKASVVIQLAGWGMSGSDMLSKKCEVVNVNGTASLLDLCLQLNVNIFVYTSTVNVVFGGQEIINGDERLPYFETSLHTDQYSRTKSVAEQLVMNYNGKKCNDNVSLLLTASIRPSAIYGKGEQRHFPRIVQNIDRGFLIFQIGEALVDWVHVDNLVGTHFIVYVASIILLIHYYMVYYY